MSGFKDVVGRNDIIEYIENVVANDKVSHAYIFSGEKGSGKKMLANLFAMTLQCESKDEVAPCDYCKPCSQIKNKNHPDVIYVTHEKPNTISVADIREQVVENISIKPYGSKYKIYIIPEAHLMNDQAQSALLKTIETPPEYAIIFLLTDNVEQILPTISSRCIMLKLRNVKDTLIKKYLMECMDVGEYQANICTAFAQGNIGKAVSLASSPHFAEIKEDAITLLVNLHDMDLPNVIDSVKKVTAYKIDIGDFFDILMIWYRDVLIYKATKEVKGVVFKDQLESIKNQAVHSSYEGIGQILTALETAKARIRANVNFEVLMELLLLTMKEN